MMNHARLYVLKRGLRQIHLCVLRLPFIITTTLRHIRYLTVSLFLVGCVPSLTWIPDPSPIPSCEPDRLVQWTDFTPRVPQDQRGAETAIRFLHHPLQHRLSIAFDFDHSWVRPDLIDPKNVTFWRMSEHLLAHEQLHFLISCLVVRQANLSMTEQDDLGKMLALTKSVAQRLNLQYDSDTQHGLNLDAQQSWETEVMSQFEELGTHPFSPWVSQTGEKMKF